MADLIFQPYAARLLWQMPEDCDPAAWERILAEYVNTLAQRCDGNQECLIGHIKGLATFPDGGFLRVNAVSASHPADLAGRAPEGCTQLSFTLNVLVYGLSRETLSHLVRNAADQVAASSGGTVAVHPASDHIHQAHNHD